MIPNYYDPRDQRMPRESGVHWTVSRCPFVCRLAESSNTPHRSNIARAIGTHTHHHSNLGRTFWLWWKTLSGSYMVFTSTSRS